MMSPKSEVVSYYFRAEDSQGRRFWLYREGLWGRETAQAKWFVHGVFG